LLCNVMLPLIIIAALIFFKQLKSVTLAEKEERLVPLLFATLCFYACYYMVSKISASELINLFLASSVIVLAGVLIITSFWKISMHMAGIGGITGLILFLMYFYQVDILITLCLVILLTGIISSSRLACRSHSIIQLIAGYFLGFILVFGCMMKRFH
jgi:hypothetical protein